MNGHRPDVHEHEQTQERDLVQWEQERINVVGQALGPAVYRVEGVRRERRRDLKE